MRRATELQLPDYGGLADLGAMLAATVRAFIEHLIAHPADLAATRAATFEPDPHLRSQAVDAIRADHLAIARTLVTAAAARGAVHDDTDLEDLTALMALLLPQLAIGALGPEPHPDRGRWDTDEALSSVLALIEVTGSAFAPSVPA